MIDPKAVEAARRIVAAADRFNKCRAEFPIEKDWDFDACSEWEDALHSACIEHGETLARALTASQGRDDVVEFAKEVIRRAWDCSIDPGDVQEIAIERGLIVPTPYDPTIHGENEDYEPGDEIYVFAGSLKTGERDE
jgi:hypothetical protein